ncbi:MAG: hypothetical protein WBA97_24840 [Actinophytocola sp.]|uniref:hypothetical protein n=1 Tax=Actinophytocola sp. TaxID=1872138 RepID=UPI003C71D338
MFAGKAPEGRRTRLYPGLSATRPAGGGAERESCRSRLDGAPGSAARPVEGSTGSAAPSDTSARTSARCAGGLGAGSELLLAPSLPRQIAEQGALPLLLGIRAAARNG